jgi:hypothetical protein
MFQLVCDPSGVVVEVALRELVPAVVRWGGKLDQILRVLLAHILASAQVYHAREWEPYIFSIYCPMYPYICYIFSGVHQFLGLKVQ